MKNDKRLDTSYKQINTKKSFKNMIFFNFLVQLVYQLW